MSEINCDACSNLRDSAANFINNGVTDKVAASLADNTGFNPDLEVLHENCEDLNDANDCLIGMLQREIDSYDVCDWKDFMGAYLGNNYEVLKAIIASDCGQWSNIEELLEKTSTLCSLTGALVAPPVTWYGKYPNAPAGHDLGVRNTSYSEFVSGRTEQFQGIGIRYGRLDVASCENTARTKVYEWIEPDIYYVDLKSGVTDGNVLWYCSKSVAQSLLNISDYLWERLRTDPFTWHEFIIWEDPNNNPSAGKTIGLELKVNPGSMGNNYVGIVFRGTSYPVEHTLSAKTRPGPVSHYLWISSHYE